MCMLLSLELHELLYHVYSIAPMFSNNVPLSWPYTKQMSKYIRYIYRFVQCMVKQLKALLRFQWMYSIKAENRNLYVYYHLHEATFRFLRKLFHLMICIWLDYYYWGHWFSHHICDQYLNELDHTAAIVNYYPCILLRFYVG